MWPRTGGKARLGAAALDRVVIVSLVLIAGIHFTEWNLPTPL